MRTTKDQHAPNNLDDFFYGYIYIYIYNIGGRFVQERTPNWFDALKHMFDTTPNAAVGEIGLDKGSRGKQIDFTDQVVFLNVGLASFLVENE